MMTKTTPAGVNPVRHDPPPQPVAKPKAPSLPGGEFQGWGKPVAKSNQPIPLPTASYGKFPPGSELYRTGDGRYIVKLPHVESGELQFHPISPAEAKYQKSQGMAEKSDPRVTEAFKQEQAGIVRRIEQLCDERGMGPLGLAQDIADWQAHAKGKPLKDYMLEYEPELLRDHPEVANHATIKASPQEISDALFVKEHSSYAQHQGLSVQEYFQKNPQFLKDHPALAKRFGITSEAVAAGSDGPATVRPPKPPRVEVKGDAAGGTGSEKGAPVAKPAATGRERMASPQEIADTVFLAQQSGKAKAQGLSVQEYFQKNPQLLKDHPALAKRFEVSPEAPKVEPPKPPPADAKGEGADAAPPKPKAATPPAEHGAAPPKPKDATPPAEPPKAGRSKPGGAKEGVAPTEEFGTGAAGKGVKGAPKAGPGARAGVAAAVVIGAVEIAEAVDRAPDGQKLEAGLRKGADVGVNFAEGAVVFTAAATVAPAATAAVGEVLGAASIPVAAVMAADYAGQKGWIGSKETGEFITGGGLATTVRRADGTEYTAPDHTTIDAIESLGVSTPWGTWKPFDPTTRFILTLQPNEEEKK